MRKSAISREKALEILRKYNKEAFHIRHGITVGAVLKNIARKNGFSDEADYWDIVGILHDVDYEMYPEQHCIKASSLLEPEGVSDDMIRAICSHAYEIHTDIKPEHEMEKTLYTVDELTGLIGACALMRPSKSCTDMELKSLKKKFKDKKFAAGCNRDIIKRGAGFIGKDLDYVLELTLSAMQDTEKQIDDELSVLQIG